MRQKSKPVREPAEQVVKDIRRATRRHYWAEDKIRIVLEGLRGEDSIAELCRREGIVQNLYYRWSKEFLEAGKKRPAGDTARAATSDEVSQTESVAKFRTKGINGCTGTEVLGPCRIFEGGAFWGHHRFRYVLLNSLPIRTRKSLGRALLQRTQLRPIVVRGNSLSTLYSGRMRGQPRADRLQDLRMWLFPPFKRANHTPIMGVEAHLLVRLTLP